MPIGPNGEDRPGDATGCAVKVAKIATGEIADHLPSNKRKGAKAGGPAKAKSLPVARRSSITRDANRVRWA